MSITTRPKSHSFFRRVDKGVVDVRVHRNRRQRHRLLTAWLPNSLKGREGAGFDGFDGAAAGQLRDVLRLILGERMGLDNEFHKNLLRVN
jgi:hypothetical protein